MAVLSANFFRIFKNLKPFFTRKHTEIKTNLLSVFSREKKLGHARVSNIKLTLEIELRWCVCK